jgi:hypothetical protein
MNRCSNEGNPKTFCPYCKKVKSNRIKHFKSHAKVIDLNKLDAYVLGIFTAGMRGPLHKGSVVQCIQDWAKAGVLWEKIDDIFACVGVPLVEKKSEAMPLYDLCKVFKRGYVSIITAMQINSTCLLPHIITKTEIFLFSDPRYLKSTKIYLTLTWS